MLVRKLEFNFNKRNFRQDLLSIENTDSDLKVHALHYANMLLVRVRLSFQKLFQNRSTHRNNTKKKNVWEESNDAHSLLIRVQSTIFYVCMFFYDNINAKENVFFQSAS